MAQGKVLQDNEDYRVEIVHWNGKLAVKKQTKETTPEHRADRLRNEIYAMRFLRDLASKEELALYVPELYEAKETYFIREYVDSEPVVEQKMPLEQAEPRLVKLAQLLAKIDKVEPFGEVKFVGHYDYRDIRKNFPKWTGEAKKHGYVTEAQIKKINSMLDNLIPYLRPRIAHGDLLPHSHAFLMTDDKIAWVDLENFSPAGARYYDVANIYNRLFRYVVTTEIPRRFLAAFLSASDKIAHQEEQLMAVMLQRVVAMQYDAWYDAEKFGRDYKERAEELLNLCLKGDLKELL